MNKKYLISLTGILIFLILIIISLVIPKTGFDLQTLSANSAQKSAHRNLNSLTILAMRQRSYHPSPITIEQTLSPGSNYKEYLASYKSDGLKIYALLTIPTSVKPNGGYPVILFNHGYIPPNQYVTTERYFAYVDAFASNGYIVFKPDYRGNGNSQGKAEGAYYSPAYTIDDLNALSSIAHYEDSNPNKIGIWGHSMGGNITLRDLVIDPKQIKAAVIWGGVVGSYKDLANWHDPNYTPSAEEQALRNKTRAQLTKKYGTPISNPSFWNSIDPTYFTSAITTPVQLDVGGADQEVPNAFSKDLYNNLKSKGKTVQYFVYPGSDHNISQGFDLAMQRSLSFFD